ncbi:hypothetical protein SH668x_001252 [Planctomicrobium sp. SH668]|uniref:hypothetical protein n=1 Tax=Planctomicrobium sp. SH668 TaxID=3448126 RepID=UPI003F5BBD74
MKATAIVSASFVFVTLCIVVLALLCGVYFYGSENGRLRLQNAQLAENAKTFESFLEEVKKRCECSKSTGGTISPPKPNGADTPGVGAGQ